MTKKYKILGKFIKDLSSETPDVETYLIVKERINKYFDRNPKAANKPTKKQSINLIFFDSKIFHE